MTTSMRWWKFLSVSGVIALGAQAGAFGSGCGSSDPAPATTPPTPVDDVDASTRPSGANAKCGNGVLEIGEDCDDGNTQSGDACQNDCSFTCIAGDPQRDHCDDKNACNGKETCGADHRCSIAAPPADGSSCGTASTCLGGNCIPASCGDGQVQSGEECDDGNANSDDGCRVDCTFTCVTGDATRDKCDDANACNGTEVCGADHKCSAGTPIADNTACTSVPKGYCKAGVCTGATCGNATSEPGETCDDGNTNDTDGCTVACAYSCTANTACDDANPCTVDTCATTTTHACGHAPDAAKNGTACTVGTTTGVCDTGSCRPGSCGNGTLEAGEACDRGNLNGAAGSGCKADCQFTCANDAACGDGNACNGTETCVAVASGAGKICQAGAAIPEAGVCQASPRRVCRANTCSLSTCGDGFVDHGAGETCDPPNGTSCDATCKLIVCGDGKIGGTEQCDDGNTSNLDGCDSKCKYEVVMRLNTLSISNLQSPAACAPRTNALGTVVMTSTALDQINPPLQAAIVDGSNNILMQAMNLDDLTGVGDANGFDLGVLSGALDPAKGTWPTTPAASQNPIDWWFKATPETVDAAGIPVTKVSATLAARGLAAGPATLDLILNLLGSRANLKLRDARFAGRIDATPAPNVPAPPPAALASGLTVFQSLTANGADQGLCGNVTVESLAKIPVPQSLTTGATACAATCANSRAYTYCGTNNPVGAGCNSMLDLIVGGCRVISPLCINAINATQPDVATGTGPATLTLTAGTNKVPDAQWQGNTNGYSAFLKFTARRAHLTGR